LDPGQRWNDGESLWHNGFMNENQTIRPTKKQKELLSFIEAFITEHGYSPSLPRSHERPQLQLGRHRRAAHQ